MSPIKGHNRGNVEVGVFVFHVRFFTFSLEMFACFRKRQQQQQQKIAANVLSPDISKYKHVNVSPMYGHNRGNVDVGVLWVSVFLYGFLLSLSKMCLISNLEELRVTWYNAEICFYSFRHNAFNNLTTCLIEFFMHLNGLYYTLYLNEYIIGYSSFHPLLHEKIT